MDAEMKMGRILGNPLASLRQYVRPRAPKERCELCDKELAEEHEHLVELASRRLTCACDACAILFGNQAAARFRRVPRHVRRLDDFQLTDELWEALQLPINLAFFIRSNVEDRVLVLYPSPAGATESQVTLDAWQGLVGANPPLARLEPDVEALLVNRMGSAHGFYRVGIDQCYKLVGIIRMHWRGLSGGKEVWDAIDVFFAELDVRSIGGKRNAQHHGDAHA